MEKEEIIFRLKAITRQLTFMSPSEFNKQLSDSSFEIKFDHFSFKDSSKIHTQIKMDKVEIIT